MGSNEPLSGPPEQPSTRAKQCFDYTTLSPKTKIVVQQRANEIKILMRRTAQDIINIGKKLTEVKEQLGHGYFIVWLRAEFDWGEWTARKFMQVARQFETVNFTDLSITTSALYILASSSTPEDARKEALERATQGEVISHTKVKAILTRHKEATKPKASKPFAIDIPAETVGWGASTPAEPHPAAHTVEDQSAAVVEQSEDKLPEKTTEALAYFQVSNCSHDMAPATDNGDCPPKDQAEIDIQSLFGVSNLICFTDFRHQETKWLGEVTEVKKAAATDIEVVIRISLSPLTS